MKQVLIALDQLANTLLAGHVVAFSPDSTAIAVAHGSSPFVTAYPVSAAAIARLKARQHVGAAAPRDRLQQALPR